MSGSKVKVTSRWKFEFLPFSKYTISKFDQAGFLIFILVFVSHDSELDQNLSGDFQKKFSSDLNEIWYVGTGR